MREIIATVIKATAQINPIARSDNSVSCLVLLCELSSISFNDGDVVFKCTLSVEDETRGSDVVDCDVDCEVEVKGVDCVVVDGDVEVVSEGETLLATLLEMLRVVCASVEVVPGAEVLLEMLRVVSVPKEDVLVFVVEEAVVPVSWVVDTVVLQSTQRSTRS